MRNANLQVCEKKFSHILHDVFCLYFLRMHDDYFFQRGFASVRAYLFKEVEAKSSVTCKMVIYLLNYDWSKSTFFMLNMTFDTALSNKQIGIFRFL